MQLKPPLSETEHAGKGHLTKFNNMNQQHLTISANNLLPDIEKKGYYSKTLMLKRLIIYDYYLSIKRVNQLLMFFFYVVIESKKRFSGFS